VFSREGKKSLSNKKECVQIERKLFREKDQGLQGQFGDSTCAEAKRGDQSQEWLLTVILEGNVQLEEPSIKAIPRSVALTTREAYRIRDREEEHTEKEGDERRTLAPGDGTVAPQKYSGKARRSGP